MKTRTLVLGSVLGCGGLIVVIAIISGGVLYWAYKNVSTTVSPRVDDLFAKIEDGTFGAAYSTETSPELQAVVPKEKWEQIGNSIKSCLGPLQSKSLKQFNVSQVNANTTMNVVYDASFEKGSGTISAQFRTIDGEWRIDSFYVNSPLLAQEAATQKCPHCGESNFGATKFCGECGKPMKNAEAAPDKTGGKAK